MEEIWKDIPNYENIYKISNHGRIKNSKEHIMKPFDNKGYLRIGLSKQGKTTKFLVHVLVANAFIPTIKNKNEINHIDCNKINNHVDNLEWVDGSENVRHYIEANEDRLEDLQKYMSDIGKKYGHIGIEASKKPVAQIDKNTNEVIQIFESAREASRMTNSNYKCISQVCGRKRKTHNGYKWRFVSDLDI